MKKTETRKYLGEDVVVHFDIRRCIHAEECVIGLPAVFDPHKRPWVTPDNADVDELGAVIKRCPTGALRLEHADGGDPESTPERNIIHPTTNGPLYIQGDIRIITPAGTVFQETRVALCRCGVSGNQPFCDNSHLEIDFKTPDSIKDNQVDVGEQKSGGVLTITPRDIGPYLLRGVFEIHNTDGRSIFHGTKAALCGCGRSQKKPFCDGNHKRYGVFSGS